MGVHKGQVLKTEMQKLNQHTCINAFREKVCLKLHKQKNNQETHYNYKDWQESDLIIGTLDKPNRLRALIQRTVQTHKTLLTCTTHNFDCSYCHVRKDEYFGLE